MQLSTFLLIIVVEGGIGMVFHYECVEQHLYHEDIGDYISYGIVLTSDTTIKIDDVSCDHEVVAHLVSLLNKHQANPIHLVDIVEDNLP